MFLLLTLAGVTCLTREVLGNDCKPGSRSAYPLNCESFYLCDENSIRHLFSCSVGLHFNQANDRCDWPENAKCSLGKPKDSAKTGGIKNTNITYNKSTDNPQHDHLGEVLSEVLGKTFGILDLTKLKGDQHVSETVIEKENKDKVKENPIQTESKTDNKLDLKKVVIANIGTEVSTEGSKEENSTGPGLNKPPNEKNEKPNVNENKKEKRTAAASEKPEKKKSLETSKQIKFSKSNPEASTEEKEERVHFDEDVKGIPKKSGVSTEEKGKETIISKEKLPENPFRYSEKPIFVPANYPTYEDLDAIKKGFGDIVGYKTDDRDSSVQETTTNDTMVSDKSKKITKEKKESSINTEVKKPNVSSKGKVIEKTNPSSGSSI